MIEIRQQRQVPLSEALERAEARLEKAEARTERAEMRTEQAKSRTESAETRAEDAETRTEFAKTRTEQAEIRAEQAESALERLIQLDAGVSPPVTLTAVDHDDLKALERLTDRQREVLQHLAAGQNTKEIASRLEISPKTVEYHRLKLMEGLNIHDIPGLVRFALRVRVVSPEG